MVGDGYCDDETNVLECNFDDGDCCGPNITTTHCTECQCLEVIVPPSGNILFKYIILNLIPFNFLKIDCTIPQWIGDGYCDDVINTELCNYDGGDCCGSSIDTTYCIECQCCDIGGCNATINGGNGGNDNEYIFNKEI